MVIGPQVITHGFDYLPAGKALIFHQVVGILAVEELIVFMGCTTCSVSGRFHTEPFGLAYSSSQNTATALVNRGQRRGLQIIANPVRRKVRFISLILENCPLLCWICLCTQACRTVISALGSPAPDSESGGVWTRGWSSGCQNCYGEMNISCVQHQTQVQ